MGLVIGTGGLHIGTSGGGASPVKRFDAEAEYVKRKAGGSDEIGTGKAKITTLKGKSVVWNQLVQNGNFENNTSGWSIAKGTATVTSGVCEITKSGAAYMYQSIPAKIEGHKYFISFSASASVSMSISIYWGATFVPTISITTSMSKYAYVATAGNGNTNLNFSTLTSSTGDVLRISNIKLLDLTLMFGAGNEPTTVAEFEAMYPLPYYDYNPGEIVNNEAEAIETVGFNQWDEEWELGTFNGQGEPATNNNRIRTKNFISVFPNTSYYRGCSKSGWNIFYDANKNFISAAYIAANTAFATPANAHYLKFDVAETITYAGDICINLSDASKNGTYEAYWKNDLQLNLTTLTGKLNGQGNSVVVFPDGLKSAGTVYDEIVGNKAIKRVGSVDMGTLDWHIASEGCFHGRVSGKKNSNQYADVLCSKYMTYPINGQNILIYESLPDKSITGSNGTSTSWCYLKDSSYNDITTLASALSGTLLYYELATPEEYVLDTPLPTKYKVDAGGTEERLPRDTASSVMAPIKYSVKYVQPKD